MRKILLIILILALASLGSGCPSSSNQPNVREIEGVIIDFQKHLIVENYDDARTYLTDDMMERLEDLSRLFAFANFNNPLELLRLFYATSEEEMQDMLDSLREDEVQQIIRTGQYAGKTQQAGWITGVMDLQFTYSDKEVYANVIANRYNSKGAQYQKKFKLVKEDGLWKIDFLPLGY